MPPWLPSTIIASLALLVTVLVHLLSGKDKSTRTDTTAAAAEAKAKAAADEVAKAHDAIAKVREDAATEKATAKTEREAVRHELDRLTRDKADVSIVIGMQTAIADLKAEVIRQFDRLETRLEQATLPRTRGK